MDCTAAEIKKLIGTEGVLVKHLNSEITGIEQWKDGSISLCTELVIGQVYHENHIFKDVKVYKEVT